MAIGRTNAGAGGAALNFKIVPGLTQPGTASENTIWVKTEKIGSWYFSATQPENMQEWDVWFHTGTVSLVEFNALRKNALQVYPSSARQMVGGVLVGVTAMSYQSGEWREWITYLYNKGDQCTDITGGWKGQIKENYTGVAPGYTFNADNIRIYKGTTSEGKMGVLATVNKIDLTNVNIVTFKITVNTTIGGAFCYVGNKNNNNEGAAAQTEVGKTTGLTEYSIDVSALTGSYYVGFRTYAAKSDTIDYTVHEVYYA